MTTSPVKKSKKSSTSTFVDVAVETTAELIPFALPPFGFKFLPKSVQTELVEITTALTTAEETAADISESTVPKKKRARKSSISNAEPSAPDSAPVQADAPAFPASTPEVSPTVPAPKAKRSRKSAAADPEPTEAPVSETVLVAPVDPIIPASTPASTPEVSPTVPAPKAKRSRKSAAAEPAAQEPLPEPVSEPVAVNSSAPAEASPTVPAPKAKRSRKSTAEPPVEPAAHEAEVIAPVEPTVPVSSPEVSPTVAGKAKRSRKSAVEPVEPVLTFKAVKKPRVPSAASTAQSTPLQRPVEASDSEATITRGRASSESSDDFRVSPRKLSTAPMMDSSDSDGEIGWIPTPAASRPSPSDESSDDAKDGKTVRITGPVLEISNMSSKVSAAAVLEALSLVLPPKTAKSVLRFAEFDESRYLVSVAKVKQLKDFVFPAITVDGGLKDVKILDDEERKEAVKLLKKRINKN